MKTTFSHPERFIAGTVGEPGERAFFIQVRSSNRLFAVALEKAQVQAIAARLEIMISEVRRNDPLLQFSRLAIDDAPLESPIEPQFQVGAISLSWNEEDKLICVEMFEMEDENDNQSQGSILEVNLDIAQAVAFATRSKAVVNAGRLPCPFCSIPIDPRGHLCPRANGYRR